MPASGAPSPEYEVRFLQFDKATVLSRAAALGAKRPVRSLLLNTMYVLPGRDDLAIRLRIAVTAREVEAFLTVKHKRDPRAGREYDLESETRVSDVVQTHTLLRLLGCTRAFTMHKLRDVVHVPGLGELDLDAHPGLPPLLEIECESEAKLRRLVKAVGLTMPADAGHQASPQELYAALYGVSDDRDKAGDLMFHAPSNLRTHITKGRARFERVLASQRATAERLLTKHGLPLNFT